MTKGPRLEFATEGKALVVRVVGPLEGYAASWQEDIHEKLDGTSGDVILNLSDATFIDSRSMGFVFDLHKRMNAAGKQLLLVLTGPAIRDAFEAAGVTDLLRIFESESIARDAL